jgi:uncharacterized protein (DUF983 family)
MLAFPFIWEWPTGLVLSLTMPSVGLLTLGLLPLVKGAVVGARSVVTKSVSAWTVSAGNPCKTIKLREWRPKF